MNAGGSSRMSASEESELRKPLTTDVVRPQPSKSPSGRGVRKNSGNEAVREFIRGLSSTTSLPAYLKGDVYSSPQGVLNQCLVAGAVLILAAAVGAPIGFSAVALPQLRKENGSLQIDDEMGSWVASIHSIATPLGSVCSGPLMEALGRRRTLIFAIIPLCIGWVVISTSQYMAQLLLGRVICGLSVGIVAAPAQVYLGEISEPRLRGLLIGTPVCAYAIGVLYIYVLGGFLHWKTMALASMGLPFIALVALIMSPESPTWLARRERLGSAAGSIAKLRGNDILSKRELYQVISTFEKAKLSGEGKQSFFQLISKPAAYKPLLLVLLITTLQNLSGTYLVIFYAVDILEAVGSTVDPTWTAIVSAVVRATIAGLCCFLLLVMTRRSLFLLSGIGASISSVILCGYLYFSKEMDPLVATIMFVFYIGFNTLGFMPLPNLMVSEILPVQIRGLCGGYIFTFMNLTIFGYTKIYPLLKSVAGIEGLFIIFASSSILGTIFLYLLMPETKNRTLLDIEKYFEGPNYLWITRNREIPRDDDIENT